MKKRKVTFLLLLLCLVTSRSMATIVYVDSSNTSSIQDGTSWSTACTSFKAGLDSARAGDSVWVAKGTYLSFGSDASFRMRDSIKIFGGFLNTDTSFYQRNWNSNPVVLKMATLAEGPIMFNYVLEGEKLTAEALLDGFRFTGAGSTAIVNKDTANPTIRNCSFFENIGDGASAIRNYHSSPTIVKCNFYDNSVVEDVYGLGSTIETLQGHPVIENCTFYRNSGATGGGISISSDLEPISGRSVIKDCIFSSNGSNRGGAIYLTGADTVDIQGCLFENNSEGDALPGYSNEFGGGAIYCASTPTYITKCQFSGNSAEDAGGAIHLRYIKEVVISDCLFTNDSAKTGGAIFNFNKYWAGPGILKLNSCRFIANAADTGSAIRNSSGIAFVLNSLFSGNVSDNDGCLSNLSSSSGLINCTMAHNLSETGAAISNTGSSVQVTNTLLWGNNAGIQNSGLSSSTIRYSLVQGMAADLPNHNLSGSVYPQFADTLHGDYRLRSTSPCVDKGNNDSIPATVIWDLWGNNRVFNDTVDIGAYEYTLAAPVVSLGNDTSFCIGNSTVLDSKNYECSYLWSTGDTAKTIVVSSSGSYSVTVTNSLGSARDTVIITVNSLPDVDLGNDTFVCDGSSLTLDAGNPGATYYWSTDSITKTIVVGEGTYSVSVTDIHSCVNTDTVMVTTKPLPVVDIGDDVRICNNDTLVLDALNVGCSYLWSNGDTTQTSAITTSGAVTVTVTDTNGCSGSETINVSVHSPEVLLGNDTAVCPGESITLDAFNPGEDHLWSTGATTRTITVDEAGIYIATVTDEYGCMGSDTIEISVAPVPVVALGNDTTIAAGEVLTLDAENTGSTYLWNTGATTRQINVTESGTYKVTVTNPEGCSASDIIHIVVDGVGLEEVMNNPDRTTIFPNPTSDRVTISIKNKKLLGTQAVLADAYGRTLRNWQLENENQSFSLEGLAAGLYMLRLESGEAFKLIKQ